MAWLWIEAAVMLGLGMAMYVRDRRREKRGDTVNAKKARAIRKLVYGDKRAEVEKYLQTPVGKFVGQNRALTGSCVIADPSRRKYQAMKEGFDVAKRRGSKAQ